jgi:DNA-binding transcriptional LysR family regulator
VCATRYACLAQWVTRAALTRAGGIAYLPENLVADRIASGDLIQVLDDCSPKFDGFLSLPNDINSGYAMHRGANPRERDGP